MSMNFNFGGVKTANVVTNNFLPAGVHDVIFKGVDKADTFSALTLHFEAVDGSGIHNENIFEPRSDQRVDSQYGQNPSESEQFFCKIKQVIEALDPDLAQKIEKEGEKFAAPDFDGFVKLLKKYLDKKVGTQTQIKLVPTKGSYVGFPGYIANISKDGNLYMRDKVIGENLVLTAKQKDAIENAAKAKPTDMRARANDELADIADDFDTKDEADDSDMPF